MEINKRDKTITISQNTGITVSIALVIMFAGAIFTLATWAADMRNRVTTVELAANGNRSDIVKLQADNTSAQVRFSEIQTQLKQIDTTLTEIRDYQQRQR